MRSYCGPDENRTHHRNIASVSRRSLGTCQPIKKNKSSVLTTGLDFTDGLFHITCWRARQSRVHYRVPWDIQTLGKGCDPMRAKVPFIRAIRTSVRFVLKRRVELLIHFNRRTVRLFCAGRMNRTLIFWLEVRSNNHYTIPAVVTTFGVGVTSFTWKGWSNPLTSRV